jgi:RNA polymerase sigma-70 factor (ECF subfamily)
MTTRHSDVYKTRRSVISGIKKTARSPKWMDFWKQYKPYVRRICRSKLENESDVDEAVSKVMQQVFQRINEYDPGKGRFRGWLKVIATRRAIEEFRRIARERRRRDNLEADPTRIALIERIPDSRPGPRTLLRWQEDRALVVPRAVQRTKKLVSPRQWQIFDCSWRREWPTEKVRERFSVTRNQVDLARSRVGRIYERELRAAASEIGVALVGSARPKTKRPSARTSRQTV